MLLKLCNQLNQKIIAKALETGSKGPLGAISKNPSLNNTNAKKVLLLSNFINILESKFVKFMAS